MNHCYPRDCYPRHCCHARRWILHDERCCVDPCYCRRVRPNCRRWVREPKRAPCRPKKKCECHKKSLDPPCRPKKRCRCHGPPDNTNDNDDNNCDDNNDDDNVDLRICNLPEKIANIPVIDGLTIKDWNDLKDTKFASDIILHLCQEFTISFHRISKSGMAQEEDGQKKAVVYFSWTDYFTDPQVSSNIQRFQEYASVYLINMRPGTTGGSDIDMRIVGTAAKFIHYVWKNISYEDTLNNRFPNIGKYKEDGTWRSLQQLIWDEWKCCDALFAASPGNTFDGPAQPCFPANQLIFMADYLKPNRLGLTNLNSGQHRALLNLGMYAQSLGSTNADISRYIIPRKGTSTNTMSVAGFSCGLYTGEFNPNYWNVVTTIRRSVDPAQVGDKMIPTFLSVHGTPSAPTPGNTVQATTTDLADIGITFYKHSEAWLTPTQSVDNLLSYCLMWFNEFDPSFDNLDLEDQAQEQWAKAVCTKTIDLPAVANIMCRWFTNQGTWRIANFPAYRRLLSNRYDWYALNSSSGNIMQTWVDAAAFGNGSIYWERNVCDTVS